MVELRAPTRIPELVEGLYFSSESRAALRQAQGRRSLDQPFVITHRSLAEQSALPKHDIHPELIILIFLLGKTVAFILPE